MLREFSSSSFKIPYNVITIRHLCMHAAQWLYSKLYFPKLPSAAYTCTHDKSHVTCMFYVTFSFMV